MNTSCLPCCFVLLLGLIVSMGGCDKGRDSAGGTTPRPDGPNVLLVTLDTTRADRLGCYGYGPARTPALDEIAASGVRFEHAFCQVPLTLPSHVSLMTGTLPPSNGIRTNGAAALPATVPTMAAVFKSEGYQTAAFVSAWVLDSMFGLDHGFDHYADDLTHRGDTSPFPQQRPGDVVCDEALAWLDANGKQPFFTWVHFFDPHDPYEPPTEYRLQCEDAYDGEIAFMDSQIRRLVEWLDAHQLREKTLIIVAGDHGEAFLEHGETTHGLFLYDTTMHVPLMLSWPKTLPTGKAVSQNVKLIDVFPTIADLLKLDGPAELQGESLRPFFETDTAISMPSYGESYYARVGFGWAPLRSYTTEDWKFVLAPTVELYDRKQDPEELNNVAGKHPDVVEQLRAELTKLTSELPTFDADDVVLDAQGQQALNSLGYVGSATPVKEDDEADLKRRDPKDMVSVLHRYDAAKRLLKRRRFQEAADELLAITQASPESDEFHAGLSAAYLELRRYPEAEKEAIASLRSVPTDPHKLCRLGDAIYYQKRVQEAVACYKKALESSPGHGPAHNKLGVIYYQHGQSKEALEHFEKSVEATPNSPSALTNLAGVHLRLGHQKEARALLEKALQIDPDFEMAKRFIKEIK